MDKELQNDIVKKTIEMIRYDFCCPDLKKAAEKWLDAIGTQDEQQAIDDYLAACANCLMPVDELIEFCKGELDYFIFGDSQAEELAHAYQLKADGAKYCDCPVCAAALDILERKNEITGTVRAFANSDSFEIVEENFDTKTKEAEYKMRWKRE